MELSPQISQGVAPSGGVEISQKNVYRGKANDVCRTSHHNVLAIISTDRISAGNGAKKGKVPGKGRANHLFSVEAFERLEKAGIPTHYLGEDREACAKFVQKADPIKLEVIARYEATGSFCRAFNVPECTPMTDAQGDPFVEFTYKSDKDGDPRITDWSIVRMGILSEDEVAEVRNITKRVAGVIKGIAEDISCKFIDFKIEFGRLLSGQLVVIDEISSDTGRFRDLKTGQKLDKDNYRSGESDEVVRSGYAEMEHRILKLRGEL